MTVPDRVKQFLRENRPAWYCSACLAKPLGLRPQQVQQATKPLGLKEFPREEPGKCSVCKKPVNVTRAN